MRGFNDLHLGLRWVGRQSGASWQHGRSSFHLSSCGFCSTGVGGLSFSEGGCSFFVLFFSLGLRLVTRFSLGELGWGLPSCKQIGNLHFGLGVYFP
jgi:hypothetical protein